MALNTKIEIEIQTLILPVEGYYKKCVVCTKRDIYILISRANVRFEAAHTSTDWIHLYNDTS